MGQSSNSGIDDLPEYKKDWFRQNGGEENWKEWKSTLEKDKNLSPTEKSVFQEIFAAEGGSFKNDGLTKGGITPKVLKDYQDELFVQELSRKHGNQVMPSNLDTEDLKNAYKGYFDSIFKKTAEKYSKENPDNPKSGSGMLDTIGDKDIAKAMADTIFRVGPGDGVEAIQNSINTTLPVHSQIIVDKALGTGNFNELRSIAKDPKRKKLFLKTLGEKRSDLYEKEESRNEYFRFGN